jgi:molybdate transport system substrate-binding protein
VFLIVIAGLLLGNVKTVFAEQEIIVSAASSLTNAMQEIGKSFESANQPLKVVFNFAASSALYMQIANGAPVDVFAAADQQTMNKAEKENLIVKENRKNFAGNTLVLIVPSASKSTVKELQSLTQSEIKRIGFGNPDTVPVGRYSKEFLEKYGLWEQLQPKLIMADSVRQVLDYVSRAEVDAGFVYGTDAMIAKEKIVVVQKIEGHQPIVYPIAVIASTKKQDIAKKFIDFVIGQKGQEILNKYGFLTP